MDIELISGIVLGLIGLITGIWKHFDGVFWKKIAIDSFELVEAIKDAKDKKSPGGEEITLEEKAAIGDEAMDIAIPLWEKFEGKVVKKK